jgi:tetraprenyl-beta-curcumene synthase
MGPIAWRRLRLGVAFIDAACRYWLTVLPLVRWETRHWRRRASAIPDPVLRRIALDTQRGEGGNLEGAAAFAAFAPLRHRRAVVRSTVAFQAIYDYVDSLVEQPCLAPATNARALHEALQVALCPRARHGAYYRRHARADDAGYLCELVDACRAATQALPSHTVIEPHLADAVARMIGYQALIHSCEPSADELAGWARAQTPLQADLAWWEAAAAGASSLGVFALIAAAARQRLPAEEVAAIDGAYFPWIGALHVLLDSLVDQPADARAGHHSLVGHYVSPDEAAARLHTIATAAFDATRALRDGHRHALLLAAMSAYYLSVPAAHLAHAAAARREVLDAAGDLAGPTLAVLRGRRWIGTLTPGRRSVSGAGDLSQMRSSTTTGMSRSVFFWYSS